MNQKEKGAVLNWFDVRQREGYFSLNDKISDILSVQEGRAALEKFFLAKFFSKIPKVFSHVYVILVIFVSFVIFSGNGLSGALSDLGKMFGLAGLPFWTPETGYYLSSYAVLLACAVFGSTPIVKGTVLKLKENSKMNAIINVLEPVMHVVLLLIVTAYFVDGSFSPFLYFRF